MHRNSRYIHLVIKFTAALTMQDVDCIRVGRLCHAQILGMIYGLQHTAECHTMTQDHGWWCCPRLLAWSHSDFLFHYLNNIWANQEGNVAPSLTADRLMIGAVTQEEPAQFANDYLNSWQKSKKGRVLLKAPVLKHKELNFPHNSVWRDEAILQCTFL